MEKKDKFFKGWICGFVDGEGNFGVSINYKNNIPCGIEVKPYFSVSQKAHSLESLKKLHDFFKCGGIKYSKPDGTYKYEVRNIDDLNLYILPFFRGNSLLTKKGEDFVTFNEICKLMFTDQHFEKEGLKSILIKAYTLSGSGKKKHSLEELLLFIDKLNV